MMGAASQLNIKNLWWSHPCVIHGQCGHIKQRYGNHWHRTIHDILRIVVRNRGSGSRCIGRVWEEMTGYLAVRNYIDSVDFQNLGKSKWDQELGMIECVYSLYGFNLPYGQMYNLPIITGSGSTYPICKDEAWRTAAGCGLLSSQYNPGEELISSPTDHGDGRQKLSNAYHLIQINYGDKYSTAVWEVRVPSHTVLVDECTSYHTTKL